MATKTQSGELRVWDPLVRVFHWSLVTAMVIEFASEDWMALHEGAGYLILGLVAVRLAWGFAGSRHARFADFVRAPGAVGRYVGQLVSGQAPRYLGHNPAGGAMIVLLLATVTVTAASGALSVTDAYWGVEWVEEVHEGAAGLLVGLIAFHLAGVLVSSLLHRENLVRAMITGRKRV